MPTLGGRFCSAEERLHEGKTSKGRLSDACRAGHARVPRGQATGVGMLKWDKLGVETGTCCNFQGCTVFLGDLKVAVVFTGVGRSKQD